MVEHVHGSGKQDPLLGLTGAPANDFGQEGFAYAGRTSHIMHITLRESPCTTGGILFSDKICRYRSVRRIGMANTSSCVYRMTRLAGCLNGCSALNVRHSRSGRR